VIFGDDRPKFGTPETTLWGKRVCVMGQIRDYRGAAESERNWDSSRGRAGQATVSKRQPTGGGLRVRIQFPPALSLSQRGLADAVGQSRGAGAVWAWFGT
jgi:hypothetical protein